MKTKIFCDSADFEIIKKLNKNPLVDGFTTNPSLMRLSGAKNGFRRLVNTSHPSSIITNKNPSPKINH